MEKELADLAIIWSLKFCLRSICRAQSEWLPSMCGAKSALLPSMCGANLQTLLCTWIGAMQTLLKWRHCLKDQQIAKIAFSAKKSLKNLFKPLIFNALMWPLWPLMRLKIFWGTVPLIKHQGSTMTLQT